LSDFLHKTFFFLGKEYAKTPFCNFFELSAFRKIEPRCWWGQSWIPPTSRPEFCLVFPETILPYPRLVLAHSFSVPIFEIYSELF